MEKTSIDRDFVLEIEFVGIAPNDFEMDDEVKAVVEVPEGDVESIIQTAIDSCPVDAISWEED